MRMTRGKLPSGYFQGVVHCLEVSASGLRLCTESGKFLDLQVCVCVERERPDFTVTILINGFGEVLCGSCTCMMMIWIMMIC